MAKTLTPPSKSNSHSKDSSHLNQLQTIFQFLVENVATASMVAGATGIYQKNICRYKRDLQKSGRLWELEKKKCKKTGFKAWYLSCNPDKAPQSNQLILL